MEKMAEENNNMDASISDHAAINDQSIGVSMASSGQGGLNQSSGLRGTVTMPPGHPIVDKVTEQVYTQQYKFRISSGLIEYKKSTPELPALNVVDIKYPYHDLPVARLGFYLEREDIIKIQRECTSARVKHVKVEVYCYQAQLPFVTSQTSTLIANNNVGYYLNKISPEVQRYRQGRIEGLTSFIANTCWGKHISELPNSTSYTSNNLGELGATFVTRNLDLRFEYASLLETNNNGTINVFNYKEHAFPIDKFIEKRWNASFNEGLFCDYEYTPTDGMWHQVGRISDNPNLVPAERWYNYSSNPVSIGRKNQVAGTYKGVSDVSGSANEQTSALVQGEVYNIEQMPLQKLPENYDIEHGGLKDVPPLIIGLSPLVTGNIGTTQGDLVPCQMTIEVRTTLVMEEKRGVDYMMRFGGNTVQPDPANGKLRSHVVFTNSNIQLMQGDNALLMRNNAHVIQNIGIGLATQPEPNITTPATINTIPVETKDINKDIIEQQEAELKELEDIQHQQIKKYLVAKATKVHKWKKPDKRDTIRKVLFKN